MLETTTESLWSYINFPNNKTQFLNNFFIPDNFELSTQIWPHQISLWKEYYCRKYTQFSDEKEFSLSKEMRMMMILNQNNYLAQQVQDLQEKLKLLSTKEEEEKK